MIIFEVNTDVGLNYWKEHLNKVDVIEIVLQKGYPYLQLHISAVQSIWVLWGSSACFSSSRCRTLQICRHTRMMSLNYTTNTTQRTATMNTKPCLCQRMR